MLLTTKEIDTLAEKHLHTLADKPYFTWFDYARAIEAKVIAKIKAHDVELIERCAKMAEVEDSYNLAAAIRELKGKL